MFVELLKVPLIFPDPLAAMPVTLTLLSLVQLNTVPTTLPVSTIVVIAVLLQIDCDDGVATAFGIGFTTTVAVMLGPVQVTPALVKLGVIVKVTVCATNVVLVSAALILPVPLAARPVTFTLLSLVQLYTVPATLPVKAMLAVDPEQIVCAGGVATAFGIGFTTTVARKAGPLQPLAVGVMVKVTVTGANVVFVKVPLIVPTPFAAIPVTVALLSLTQLNTVPATAPLGTIAMIDEPLQIVCVTGDAVAFGVGFTSTVAVIVAPLQPLAAGVIVKLTVIGILVVLVNVPAILPAPLAAMPVTVATLSRVQL